MLRKHDLVAILATYPSTARVIRRKVIRHILREKVRLFVSLVARTRLMAGAAASSSPQPRHRPSKAELQSLLSAVCSTDGGLPLPVALLALRGATDRYARLLHATATRMAGASCVDGAPRRRTLRRRTVRRQERRRRLRRWLRRCGMRFARRVGAGAAPTRGGAAGRRAGGARLRPVARGHAAGVNNFGFFCGVWVLTPPVSVPSQLRAAVAQLTLQVEALSRLVQHAAAGGAQPAASEGSARGRQAGGTRPTHPR